MTGRCRPTLSVDAVTGSWANRSIRPNPEYQRGLQWKRRQQQLLIDSIFRGYPLPRFYFERSDHRPPPTRATSSGGTGWRGMSTRRFLSELEPGPACSRPRHPKSGTYPEPGRSVRHSPRSRSPLAHTAPLEPQAQAAQHDRRDTSRVKAWAVSLSASAIVRYGAQVSASWATVMLALMA